MADPWFTDADVQVVAELMVTQHSYFAFAGMMHWRDYDPEARAVLASLTPRIAQERADAWDEGAWDATMDYGIGKATNPYRADEPDHEVPCNAPGAVDCIGRNLTDAQGHRTDSAGKLIYDPLCKDRECTSQAGTK